MRANNAQLYTSSKVVNEALCIVTAASSWLTRRWSHSALIRWNLQWHIPGIHPTRQDIQPCIHGYAVMLWLLIQTTHSHAVCIVVKLLRLLQSYRPSSIISPPWSPCMHNHWICFLFLMQSLFATFRMTDAILMTSCLYRMIGYHCTTGRKHGRQRPCV